MTSRRIASLLVAAPLALAGCGATSTDQQQLGNQGSWHNTSAVAPAMAVASPVAPSDASPAGLAGARGGAMVGATPPTVKSLPALLRELQDLAHGVIDGHQLGPSETSRCVEGVTFAAASATPSCYGPPLTFLGYPGGTAGWTGSDPACQVSDAVTPGSGCLPAGDVGMWDAVEASTGEACAAATLNSSAMNAGKYINDAVRLMAAYACVPAAVGISVELPPGGSFDARPYLGALPGLTAAEVRRLADHAAGQPTFRVFVDGAVGDAYVHVLAIHSPATDTAAAGGLVHGWVRHDGIQTAFSALFANVGGRIQYELRSGDTLPTLTDDDLFDASGAFDFGRQVARGGGVPGGGTLERGDLDAATGLGSLIHAWQAGNADGHARVFVAGTTPVPGGDTGVGYFGFGPALDSDARGSLDGMFCNWAGPGNDRSAYATDHVQGQTMVRGAAGLFVPVVSHLAYAPTSTCDVSPDDAAGGLVFAEGYQGLVAMQSLAPAAMTNDLVKPSDFEPVPVPAAPPPYVVTP